MPHSRVWEAERWEEEGQSCLGKACLVWKITDVGAKHLGFSSTCQTIPLCAWTLQFTKFFQIHDSWILVRILKGRKSQVKEERWLLQGQCIESGLSLPWERWAEPQKGKCKAGVEIRSINSQSLLPLPSCWKGWVLSNSSHWGWPGHLSHPFPPYKAQCFSLGQLSTPGMSCCWKAPHIKEKGK